MRKRIATSVGIGLLAPVIVFAGIDARQSGNISGARTGLTIVVPGAAGGGWDTVARELQAAMRENDIVSNPQVVNISGAAGTIGLNQILEMRGRDDVVMITGTTMVGGIEVNNLGQDLTETGPLRRLADDYLVLAVPASSPFRTLGDFTAAWQNDPGAVSIGGGSLGGSEHVLTGLMGRAGGVDAAAINYIAYGGGGELLPSMLSDSVAAGISSFVEFGSQIENGDLRALAISAADPVPGVDIPTFREQGLNVDLVNWRGVVSPPGVSPEGLSELSTIIDETVDTPQWQGALERNQWLSEPNTPEQFSAFIADETIRIRAIIEEAGL
ncbi:tricarboxylic transporter [Rhodococcus sp. 06-412-2C]|uniref:Bug family tripartite tricarboxylate transporter substrate binding protein n=1 Tax=unclassified Rhodococcus (in: high G+C Gram-positive bacteria) TaxID=192944 RepID=UPI000B9B79CA|nr:MULTISPECIES: tripartite tricarboxylate transporter substrate-binding protein [unclassified Rhodococcus (in: high G+C Gram-positive bacteria)]OZC87396.1 tricarboxylic transporter [Rhodococcus sp. 06-412-2C]OZD00836.1 tricarboxylic transporter [Rhodococcus sp. 06-412-2B]